MGIGDVTDSTQTDESTSGDVDIITELFQDLISDLVDLKSNKSNVFLLQYLNMKSAPNKAVSDHKVNNETNLEKIEEQPEIEFESIKSDVYNSGINSKKAAVQRLENSRKNIGDVIDKQNQYTTIYSINANSLRKTKYHTILSIAPKEITSKLIRKSQNVEMNAITDNVSTNIGKNGSYQCFQVISSTVVKSTECCKSKHSKTFKINDPKLNLSTKAINKNQKKDNQTQLSKLKMNTLNSSELSERIKHLARRINLNRMNKRMKIEKNVIDHSKMKSKTKTPLPTIATTHKQQKSTQIVQPKLQVSTVGCPVSPNWATKQLRDRTQSKSTTPKNKKVDRSTQKLDQRKRNMDFVAKRIEIQPLPKSNTIESKTCHLKLVLAEMDKRKVDTKQYINDAVAEQLRTIFKNIKDTKPSPKILVKPPKLSNEYEKQKLMNSIPGILNDILDCNTSSISRDNNTTDKKYPKAKNRVHKLDTPIHTDLIEQLRGVQKIERETKYVSSETKLLNSIKPEDIRPISAEYSKQKKLNSISKSTETVLSTDLNTELKKNIKNCDDIEQIDNDLIPSPRKFNKHKVSILKFNDILKLKRLSNTLSNYFRRSNRSFETIIPLTVQCLYNKGKVLTKHQFTLWKQYNAKNCIILNKSNDNHAFVRPYTPLIELPLKSVSQKSTTACNPQKNSQERYRSTANISSQDSDMSDDEPPNGVLTNSDSTSVLTLSSHVSEKDETVLQVINSELDDDVNVKNDPTLGGILGLTVHNLKNNNVQYVRSIIGNESNDWLYKQYPPLNNKKLFTIPMIRRIYDPKNGSSRTVQDYIDLKSTLVC